MIVFFLEIHSNSIKNNENDHVIYYRKMMIRISRRGFLAWDYKVPAGTVQKILGISRQSSKRLGTLQNPVSM